MSEKRFVKDHSYLVNYDKYCILDKVQHKHLYLDEVCKKLNEQQSTITELNKQIEQLNLAIDDLLTHTSCDEIKKQNEQLRTQLTICQQSKKDDGRFQVWEVPPIPKGMRIKISTGEKDE